MHSLGPHDIARLNTSFRPRLRRQRDRGGTSPNRVLLPGPSSRSTSNDPKKCQPDHGRNDTCDPKLLARRCRDGRHHSPHRIGKGQEHQALDDEGESDGRHEITEGKVAHSRHMTKRRPVIRMAQWIANAASRQGYCAMGAGAAGAGEVGDVCPGAAWEVAGLPGPGAASPELARPGAAWPGVVWPGVVWPGAIWEVGELPGAPGVAAGEEPAGFVPPSGLRRYRKKSESGLRTNRL
jgi:hypothetical protein